MLLSDLGAEVLRIDRDGGNGWPNPIADRGRATLVLDIRTDEGREQCLRAAEKADVVMEGFRPGVMERLGLGPEVLTARNPRLIYARVTGWGQSGPLAQTVGHDINFISLSGALAALGPANSPPVPPLNLVGDFGGGSMFLAFGILAAVIERERSGRGQVVDAAIVDGVSSLMTMFSGLVPFDRISLAHDRNLLGGAAPFYRCYLCRDGLPIAVGALEPKFYAELLTRIGAPAELFNQQNDPATWQARSEILSNLFATRTRAEWCALLEGTDACFSPVLTLAEAVEHPHLKARGSFVERDGLSQPVPAPRFSRTPGRIQEPEEGVDMLRRWAAVR
jgi:alpha-methylacyl-CoA racemase